LDGRQLQDRVGISTPKDCPKQPLLHHGVAYRYEDWNADREYVRRNANDPGQARYPSAASAAAIAVMFTMPRAVTEGVRTCAGLAGPIRIGPTGKALAMTRVS
jgi:hypothetical protein